MKTRSFLAFTAAYVVLTFVIAAGWHLTLFKDVYDTLGIFTRKEPIIPLGLASMIMQGALVAYLFPRLIDAGRPIFSGMKTGLVLGLFMGSNAVLAEAQNRRSHRSQRGYCSKEPTMPSSSASSAHCWAGSSRVSMPGLTRRRDHRTGTDKPETRT